MDGVHIEGEFGKQTDFDDLQRARSKRRCHNLCPLWMANSFCNPALIYEKKAGWNQEDGEKNGKG